MTIKQFDTVRLKDGRIGAVVEIFDNVAFLVDIGSSPADWDTILVSGSEIDAVVNAHREKSV